MSSETQQTIADFAPADDVETDAEELGGPVYGSIDCPRCGRSISKKSASLVDSSGCPFCREDGQ